jgi:hypothetical protein
MSAPSKFDRISQLSGSGIANLTIPPVPKLIVPEKIGAAFPDLVKAVDEHHLRMEEWRKKTNVAMFGVVPPV